MCLFMTNFDKEYQISNVYAWNILQEKIDLIHEQVIRGDKNQVFKLLDKKGWANARDHYGHSALHKSVMANQGDIMKFLLNHHPEHIEDRDNVWENSILHFISDLKVVNKKF